MPANPLIKLRGGPQPEDDAPAGPPSGPPMGGPPPGPAAGDTAPPGGPPGIDERGGSGAMIPTTPDEAVSVMEEFGILPEDFPAVAAAVKLIGGAEKADAESPEGDEGDAGDLAA